MFGEQYKYFWAPNVISHVEIRSQNEEITDEDIQNDITQAPHDIKQKPVYRYTKLILLSCCWFIFTVS